MTTTDNFVFLDKNIDVSRVLASLKHHYRLWDMVSKLEHTAGDKNPPGFLPLVMGVQEPGKRIKDSVFLKTTSAIECFPDVFRILGLYGIESISRAAFFRLPPGERVKSHIDDGTYYHNRDRFHLSIQGNYEYTVDGETHLIEPGTLFWFDNKKLHSALNVDTVDRITFVFDVPKSESPMTT